MSEVLIEVCVDSVESALAAQEGGADRVELCANLLEGGTTPSAGAIAVVRERLRIGVHVLIRTRGGDFCYSEPELDAMSKDVLEAKRLGADGVVIGILSPSGSVDKERTSALIALARPMSVTFHRAFDMAREPLAALEDLMALGIERLLTTGQEPTALEGLDLIAELVQHAGERLIVMPGGGHERNIRKIVAASRAREVHVVGTHLVSSRMQHRNERVFMGGELRPAEYAWPVTDAESIQRLRERINR